MINDITSVNKLLEEMITHQQLKVLKVAREIKPNVTPEDIRNPQDFPELYRDAMFNYEDGILTGFRSFQKALHNLI